MDRPQHPRVQSLGQHRGIGAFRHQGPMACSRCNPCPSGSDISSSEAEPPTKMTQLITIASRDSVAWTSLRKGWAQCS